MSEKSFRTILFVALLLVAPAIVFLVQVVFIVPPVFLLAGLAYMLKKLVVSGFSTDSLAFIAFFIPHLLIFAGVYWVIAWIVAKLGSLLPRGTPRYGLLIVLLLGLAGVTQLPIYGGGGHGPSKVGPLQELLAGLEKSYGSGSMLTVYLTALGLVGATAAWCGWKKKLKKMPA